MPYHAEDIVTEPIGKRGAAEDFYPTLMYISDEVANHLRAAATHTPRARRRWEYRSTEERDCANTVALVEIARHVKQPSERANKRAGRRGSIISYRDRRTRSLLHTISCEQVEHGGYRQGRERDRHRLLP